MIGDWFDRQSPRVRVWIAVGVIMTFLILIERTGGDPRILDR